MIIGTYSIPPAIEESTCRSADDYEFSDVGDFKFHSVSILPNIPFERAAELPEYIDASIFANNSETKLNLDSTIKTQNYFTAKYVGRAPLEFYGPKTEMGREFIFRCQEGILLYKNFAVGTEDAIRGYNRDANENVINPLKNKGGKQ